MPPDEARQFKDVSFSGSAAKALATTLLGRISGEVRFDDGSRALYATDASNYRQVPIGVVIPKTVEDVVATVAACREHGAPILARGGGTSLAGQCCNTAVVLDMSKYLNRILDIDTAAKRARVQPGCVLDHLRARAEEHRLTFGPDPATHDHNTLGGMIGNNSCGVHSVTAGRTADNVEELEILTYDGLRLRVGPTSDAELDQIIREGGRRGQIYKGLKDLRDKYADQIRSRFPDIPRRVSGLNLPALLPENGFNVARALVGSESICVLVLEAGLRLVHSPPGRALLILGYPDVFTAGDHVPQILEHKPIGLEAIDDRLLHYMHEKGLHDEDVELLPPGGGWLYVEIGGEDDDEAEAKGQSLMEALKRNDDAPSMKLFLDKRQQAKLWGIRESGLGATAHVKELPDTWPGWEDAAVPPDKVGAYLRDFRALLDRYDYNCSLYGHFGDGCIHCRINFDLRTQQGIDRFRAFLDDAADLVLKYGGSFSGEHGDGQARAALLPKMFGAELIEAFREFKAIWDPDWKMNPGKLVDPYPITANLRVAGYHPRDLQTTFSYPEDQGSFAHAAERCVGVGKCRRMSGNVMCPSYMVTGEEMHSTRGRARLLFEMVRGGPLDEGWRSDAVREALDLCLACKGCKGDCPVNVDMATYKAEFFSHYYKGRLRPRTAYSMGLIYWWSRVASHMPGFANAVLQASPFSGLAKAAGGIAPQRRMPRFARQTFKEWYRQRGSRGNGRRRVILWPDTFNNHFHPEVGAAAVEVLEAAGCEVVLPEQSLCCGRPLYGWGMLGLAQKELRRILDGLGGEIDQGVPVIGLEPACLTTFRDELPNLFPRDDRAKRLCAQSFMLSEFLEREVGYEPPKLERKALVHAHCNQHSVLGMADEKRMLSKLGLDYAVLESGCCGMAGSFGFEADHYDVSMKAGERMLLPVVRAADGDCLVITNGYSCREQIDQCTGRQALHSAEVLQMALRHAGEGQPRENQR
ncbi:FAD-binding and (Fe-S)-binding domain-containing protein [Rhodospirillaceae bacterium SYSU D60014]|uniref:FAD-binding and (Fe-S)-binding domain-containing protein n=1 Tax=Virgifigura deserti TaxID=2268457 RepID=UPI000E67059F